MIFGTVRPVREYEQICKDLEQYFEQDREAPEDKVKLVGLLFARPTSSLAKEEVIPNLRYFHYRSANFFHFYCGGYWEGSDEPDPRTGREQVALGWMYDDESFNEFRQEIESMSQWRYSGGVDLILTNARLRPSSSLVDLLSSPYSKVYLDFSSAIAARLDQMRESGAITRVETFLESICAYAETQDKFDPARGFSDLMGGKVAGSALKTLLLYLLPAGLEEEARKAFHFAVTDISAKERRRRHWRSWFSAS